MTAVLVLLCLVIAGLELYVAFWRRRRPDTNAGRISELEAARAALEARVAAAEQQLHDLVGRVEHDLSPVVGRIHVRVQDQLEAEKTETLGGPPHDSGTLAGGLSADLGDSVSKLYRDLLDHYDIRVRLQVAEPTGMRYYLACPAGRGPVELEWDFIAMLEGLRGVPNTKARDLEPLLRAVGDLEKGFVQLGPLVVVRTPDALLAGVLSVSESREFDTAAMLGDLAASASALQGLPPSRFHDLTGRPQSFNFHDKLEGRA